MRDGLQNISFDRVLMRIKDITAIISNFLTIATVISTALWISFKFIESQNQQQKIIDEFILHFAGKR